MPMRMKTIHNPFGVPVCFYETVGSTMDVCRRLAAQGKPHGTVVSADYQEAGDYESAWFSTNKIMKMTYTLVIALNLLALLSMGGSWAFLPSPPKPGSWLRRFSALRLL